MTIEELKAAIATIDAKLDDDNTTDEEFDALQLEAQKLTAKLGKLESEAVFRNGAKVIGYVSPWYDKFLSSFGDGSRKVTNKQAEYLWEVNKGKPFIWRGRRFDCRGGNYRAGFGTLVVTPLQTINKA